MRAPLLAGFGSLVLSTASPQLAAAGSEPLVLAICHEGKAIVIAEDGNAGKLGEMDTQRLERASKQFAAAEWFASRPSGDQAATKTSFPKAAVRMGSRSKSDLVIPDAVALGACGERHTVFTTRRPESLKAHPVDAPTLAAVGSVIFDEVCPKSDGENPSTCLRGTLSSSTGLTGLTVQALDPSAGLYVATYRLVAATKDPSTKFVSML